MKIGIISDTHLREPQRLNDLLETKLNDLDLLIHAGDYGSYQVFQSLGLKGKFIGVRGNIDDWAEKVDLKEKEVIKAGSYLIGICHGAGAKGMTRHRAYQMFQDQPVDLIIFGHSHQPLIQTYQKVIMINPGSITNKRKERWYSFAVLRFNGIEIITEMHFLEMV